MAGSITDSEVRLLAAIATTLKSDYVREGAIDPWDGSPFQWIKRVGSSRRIGKIGEQLVAGWCAAKGLDVIKSPNAQADRIIGGRAAEIKFSTLWESGVYTFQQIRDQDYEYAICLGLSPFTAHCWVISKELLRKHIIGHRPQHRGKAGIDTFWLSVLPSDPQDWLSSCGGTLAEAYQILQAVRHT